MTGRAPLILLPGLLCDAQLWRHQTESLADIAEISVADLTHDDTMDGMARRVLAAAPARFALAGLSMGGYVALAVTRRAPERVTHLALLDTSARPDTAAQTAARQPLIALAREGRFGEVSPTLLPSLIHPARHGDRALCDTVLAMAASVGCDAYLRQQAAIIGRPDSRPGLDAIHCPTLVLCGRQDERTPVAVHEEMAASIAGARLVVVDDCGHLSTLERPDSVTSAMRSWLTNSTTA